MSARRGGYQNKKISDTPISIIDFETTGLTPGNDRVIEISVARMNPGEKPKIVFDTLVNPLRRVSATEIHGITDEDVKDAPQFKEIAGDFIDSISNCFVSAYNVYFDIKFLDFELQQSGINHQPPHFCLMYMRPMLGLGNRCRLEEACRSHGIQYDATHIAADDVLASAKLMEFYYQELKRRSINTFSELASLKNYKYIKSFNNAPISPASEYGLRNFGKIKSRSGQAKSVPKISIDPSRQAIMTYWDALTTVVADLVITDEELEYMTNLKQQLKLKEQQIRVLHARAFTTVISQFINDQWLDNEECEKLKKLHECLATLGWAPGL